MTARTQEAAGAGRTSGELMDVIVIGGSQAGLATAWYLARHRLRFVVLDAGPELGHTWRSRWDSLTLFTPAQYDALPGMAFPGPPDSYPGVRHRRQPPRAPGRGGQAAARSDRRGRAHRPVRRRHQPGPGGGDLGDRLPLRLLLGPHTRRCARRGDTPPARGHRCLRSLFRGPVMAAHPRLSPARLRQRRCGLPRRPPRCPPDTAEPTSQAGSRSRLSIGRAAPGTSVQLAQLLLDPGRAGCAGHPANLQLYGMLGGRRLCPGLVTGNCAHVLAPSCPATPGPWACPALLSSG